MRGKGRPGRLRVWLARITPAYAGKSCIYRSTTSISWDHPRVCGEKSFKTSTSCWSKGSPPRMRGKGCACAQCASGGGITPAYAGKSPSQPYRLPDSQDHPRVCGEKTSSFISGAPIWGSPPRMRGKAFPGRLQGSFPGITPAYAGKRPGPQVRREGCQDHPRVCGEKYWRHSRFI